jgi:endonuclease/exonuclease/phosphatase family metal-dependent hydrolase
VYDAHFDAGPGAGDVAARRSQLQQLVETIQQSSAEHALVLGGDFNLSAAELPHFRERLRALGVVDACDELRCAQGFRIDRVLYRSSSALKLKARAWRVASNFRDASGRALSDHEPVVVSLSWSTK